MEKQPTFPIKKTELQILREEASSFIKSVQWEQGYKARNRDGSKEQEDILLYLSKAKGSAGADAISISKTILNLKKRLLPDSVALPLALNETLFQLQEAIAIGLWIRDSYYDASGLSILHEKRAGLSSAQRKEYESKQQTSTAFMVFSLAYYMVSKLKEKASEDNTVMHHKFAGIPEVSLLTPTKGISCQLFYYDKYMNHPNLINSEQDVIDFTVMYFEAYLDEIMQRKGALDHTDVITDRTYQLEDSDFSIAGWETVFTGNATSVEFNPIRFEQIVGNKDAKHFAKRLVERLMSYDLATKRNPFQELGGFMPVFMGYGIPGTGKSMLIAAIATMLKERCDHLDIPFLFHPMPDTVVSTFQGGSAEKMVQWMKPMQDPTRLIFAPIDDAENNLQERTAQGVSAGVKEVIGVFLRYTEGAYAVNHGNSSIGLFTNLPEQLDKAVISRIQGRFKIDGARTEADFLDQDYIWWSKIEKTLPGFVSMNDHKSYTYLSDQTLANSAGEILGNITEPSDEKIKRIFNNTLQNTTLNDHLFYANLYEAVQKEFPFFSSRDIRNIQSAISLRLTDFNLEDDWFENPELYFQKDYDTKLGMLKELMKANMKGLNFAEIRKQEVIRYLDNVATIADTDFSRKVDQQIMQIKIAAEARDRFEERLK
ncbi:ATPase family protein associated with various cellular activities (AAA) [Kordia periserrulae]|uniref:ATPase family protein associated with various cellular activities (AAA) n=1 Tax=Kordia periserrulae TaxID=701523 RepID=A0A2T6BXP9_9FLAO|nr:AAA family ATPase [Kordia periserrulae]PTX60862.1 ATPase family protein associated with various cellular activities (AAA) [Kordia periserrulae]